MNIGIIELSIKKTSNISLYNDQEIGLGKALSRKGNFVEIYKFVDKHSNRVDEKINENLTIHYIPSKRIGNNSLVDTNNLNKKMDLIICFSDIQLGLSKIYYWARKNSIMFYPYVGVLDSTSSNLIVRLLMNISKIIAISIYKNCLTLTKTKYVEEQLNKVGIKTLLVPVGLDKELLNNNYQSEDRAAIKKEFGNTENEKILLLVGRLENDRNPLSVVDVFDYLFKYDNDYRLLIVGKGSLENEIVDRLKSRNLYKYTEIINEIENKDMWKVYLISNKLVSFNRNEIFGMSIIEAMYYGLPVYVLKAPGPNDYIDNGETGYIFEDINEMKEMLVNDSAEISEASHLSIENDYTWEKIVEKYFSKIIKNEI